jgi:hypothetical protein
LVNNLKQSILPLKRLILIGLRSVTNAQSRVSSAHDTTGAWMCVFNSQETLRGKGWTFFFLKL